MIDSDHRLVAVETEDQWTAYHYIRGKTLFDDRGNAGKYNAQHPHDRLPGNYPVLLFHKNTAIGAMRIDIRKDERTAIMRTIAILRDYQRKGHGAVMMRLAERFAIENNCATAVTNSVADAVVFYGKCGYEPYDWDPQMPKSGGGMRKLLT